MVDTIFPSCLANCASNILGSEEFLQELLAAAAQRMGATNYGTERRETEEAKAQRLVGGRNGSDIYQPEHEFAYLSETHRWRHVRLELSLSAVDFTWESGHATKYISRLDPFSAGGVPP